jgi:hypothetical protein
MTKITEPQPTELGDFYYHTYQKIITWKKDYYKIIAKSKEEADAAMKTFFQENELYSGLENENDLPLAPSWYDCGDYYEGDEDLLSYEDNNSKPTEELYDDEGALLDDNTPIQIKRDKKLHDLFLNK